jgi:hypothetical protein
MSTQMPLLPPARIYCLRAVVASCVGVLLLFITLYWDLQFLGDEYQDIDIKDWLSLGLTIFTLLHHLLM